jgi:hypothetical protein
MLYHTVTIRKLWMAMGVLLLALTLSPLPLRFSDVEAQPIRCVPLDAGADVVASVRGAAFDFLDHELAHAGSYGLCAATLVAR